MPVANATPLTDEQRALAEQFVPLAYKLAGRASRRLDRDFDACLSDAMFALVNAARSYKPVPEAAGFMTYAYASIEFRYRRRGRRMRTLQLSQIEEWKLPGRDDAPAPVEAIELCEKLRRRMPEDRMRILWLHFAEGRTVANIASEMNKPAGRITQRLNDAIEEARRAFPHGVLDRSIAALDAKR
jgi:RNA polymerase sigma factor (sigma-70 family)